MPTTAYRMRINKGHSRVKISSEALKNNLKMKGKTKLKEAIFKMSLLCIIVWEFLWAKKEKKVYNI